MPIRNSIRHYLARPYYGSRRMAAWLATQGHHVNRKWVQRLMRLLGSVTLAWRAQLEPGTAYYWNDIPIPPELVRDRKLYGRARLTAVLRPLVSPFGGANYFASRLETSLRYPNGSGSFLAYLAKCAVTGQPDTVFGYDGKQVRDNIHSWDLVNAFWHFVQKSSDRYSL